MASHAFMQLRLGSLAAAAALALTAQAANVKPVTWEDIANDHKTTADVLTYGLGLTAQRYSPAKTLNTKNVSGLVPVWSYSFGGEKQRGQEAQALIHDGVMYVTASYSRFVALDVRTGKRLWTYEHRLPEDIRPCCDVVNRGPAIFGDKVYFGTLDARVVALDRNTGKVVWNEKFGDHKVGYTMTGAPFIIKDQKTGKTLLVLDTVTGSPAQTLYENLGFTLSGTIPHYAMSTQGMLESTSVMYKVLM